MFKLLKIETLKLISYQDLRKREDTGCEVGRLLVVQERMSDLQGKCRRGKKENVVRSMTSSLLQGKSWGERLEKQEKVLVQKRTGAFSSFPWAQAGISSPLRGTTTRVHPRWQAAMVKGGSQQKRESVLLSNQHQVQVNTEHISYQCFYPVTV